MRSSPLKFTDSSVVVGVTSLGARMDMFTFIADNSGDEPSEVAVIGDIAMAEEDGIAIALQVLRVCANRRSLFAYVV